MRPCAIGRKNWLFLGNDQGGHTAAVLLSFMASAKANQVEPWAYLRDLISQFAEHARGSAASQAFLTQLLPDVWLARHSEAYRSWSR